MFYIYDLPVKNKADFPQPRYPLVHIQETMEIKSPLIFHEKIHYFNFVFHRFFVIVYHEDTRPGYD